MLVQYSHYCQHRNVIDLNQNTFQIPDLPPPHVLEEKEKPDDILRLGSNVSSKCVFSTY